MENNNNNQNEDNKPKKFNFNSYWIYGMIALFLIALNVFSAGGLKNETINFGKFSDMVKRGDVQKLEIINNNDAYVYLTKEAVKKQMYRDANKKGFIGQQSTLSVQHRTT